MNRSILAALQLQQYGLTPIPLNEKRPLIDSWPTRFIDKPLKKSEIHNGLKNSDGRVVHYENNNIGIITGKVSNCIVLDFDDMSLLNKLKTFGEIPRTWTVQSNRGIHLYFQYDNSITNFKLWNDIDVLSDKKQVVAPPSIHPSGKKYKWLLSPKEVEKEKLPSWLLKILIEESKTSKISRTQYKNNHTFKSNEINDLLQNLDWHNFYNQITENIKGRGEWLNAKCPFHDDNHNSFGFNILNGSWKCFADCGSGSGFKAIQKAYNLSTSQTIRLIKGENIYV